MSSLSLTLTLLCLTYIITICPTSARRGDTKVTSLSRKDKDSLDFPRGSVKAVRDTAIIPEWLRTLKRQKRWRKRHKKEGRLQGKRVKRRHGKGSLQNDGPLDTPESGLFPMVFNLASRAEIISNATCGESGSETFCKLVEHVKGESRYIQCGVCDANSQYDDERHPVTNAIDGSHSWWQSPSIVNGREYHWVTVTLDLKQVYQVAYVVITAANSPRPGNWILERSLDGVDYKPWQYYAISDSECWNTYGVPPTVGIPRYKSDDEVICSSAYSHLNPMQNGEIHTSLVNGRPGVKGPTQELLDFTRARYIRLRLQKIRTLNADLMTFIYNDPKDLDPTVSNRYYYSIKDISVGGQCICYGHARECPIDQVTGEMACQCEGNTCGGSCEKCCPLYNQLPWQPGTYAEGFQCERCNCMSHADVCEYNQTVADLRLSMNMAGEYRGGGVCLDCRDNTMGVNCELCEDGYYHPPGVSQHDPDACRMCLCTSPGATGLCVKDSSLEMQGVFAGDCMCKEGFCGPRCEECAPGYRGYPYCEPCPCNQAGSINFDSCEDECVCKIHVCGEHCDECLPGFYNLDLHNLDGCDPCFCFGLSHQCESLTWGRKQLTSLHDWVVTDLAGSGFVTPVRSESGVLTVTPEHVASLNKAIYWKAPEEFIGNKVLSYGGVLEFVFTYKADTTTEDPEAYLANYDIVIEGSGMRFGHSGQYWDEDCRNLIAINMTEHGWRHLEGSTSPRDTLVPKEEFMIVLGLVDRLLIRSTFHMHQTEAQLLQMSLDVASRTGLGETMHSVEKCLCPEGYAGTSCESCAVGYRRVSNLLFGGTCEPCDCNGHAESCDPYTGLCLECVDNTVGEHCDQCASGCHGDPFSPDGCFPCACPLDMPSNNFAETCVMMPDGQGEYKCVGCPPGYEGDYCEICARGYYGDPLTPGNYCMPCDCHGNKDSSLPEPCDRMTGRCYGCLGNTEGNHCERCKPGYHGSGVNGDCKACECDAYGSLSPVCEAGTGQCTCKDRYTGRDCGQCQHGYGNIAVGCESCKCSLIGSESDLCDPVTGYCSCRSGVRGQHCTECKEGFFGFSVRGCEDCHCHGAGSLSTECGPLTGECECRPHVSGKYCDACWPGYWGLSSRTGCKICDCDPVGSEVGQCDLESGQCVCRSGVMGYRCDQCEPGFYGFAISGCQRCPVCVAPGQVCDPVSGECVCPPNTEGPACSQCVVGAWDYHPLRGCRLCECELSGSMSLQCDVLTGQCDCRLGYQGQHCDQCPHGYYDFPRCMPCDCDTRGSQPEACEGDLCQCDVLGQCPCKENVGGSKCDRCQDSTFSLQTDNPSGCTACFCFGRTAQCGQSAYSWNQISLSDQSISVFVSENSTQQLSMQGFLVIPPGVSTITLHPDHIDLPLYFSLSKELQHDQTLSYNGRLRFRLTNALPQVGYEGLSNISQPDMYIVGNFRVQLQYVGVPTSSEDTQDVEVILREDLWIDDSGKPVSREQFLVALQNIQHWLVKASDYVGISERQLIEASSRGMARLGSARLSDVNLQRAVPSDGTTNIAFGVEVCQCPAEYAGLSCQNPAVGYYRERPGDLLGGHDFLDLVGVSRQCQCYGHSTECDRESGVCLNCLHNTSGNQCDVCADGFYGYPTLGNLDDCRPCACPLTDRSNNFSPTCVSVGTGDEYYCDNCIDGYTGERCDSCAPGYYGDPLGPGCVLCDCDPEGSLGVDCMQDTGECHCYPGITGAKCDRCQSRHVVSGQSCMSCEDGCPGILFTSIDDFTSELENFDLSAVLPFARINMMEQSLADLPKSPMNVSNASVEDLQEIAQELHVKAQRAQDQVNNELERTALSGMEGEDIWFEAEDIASEAMAVKDMADGYIATLEDVGRTDDSIDVGEALKEAEEIIATAKRESFAMIMDKLNADTEILLMNITMQKVIALDEKSSIGLNATRTRLDNDLSKLEEIRSLSAQTEESTANTTLWNEDNVAFMQRLQDKWDEILEAEQEFQVVVKQCDNITEDASFLLWNVSSGNYQASTDMLSEIRDKADQVQTKTDLFEKGLPTTQPVHSDSILHAQALQAKALQLEQQFADTRVGTEDALKAAQVYSVMADGINEADNASIVAEESAQNATQLLEDGSSDPVPQQLEQAFQESKDLNDNSTAQNTQVQGMTDRLVEVKQDARTSAENLQSAAEGLEIIRTKFNFDQGVADNLTGLSYQSISTISKADKAQEIVMDIIEDLEDNLSVKVEEMTQVNIHDVGKANASVNSARRELDRLINLTEVLSEQKERVEKIGVQVGLDLLELKEKIRQARELAKSIKISLHHQGSCVRRYEADVESSTTNTISLYFKTEQPQQDMLLFMIHSKNSSEYLVVELVERRVRFSWDVGGGLGSVTHDLEVTASRAEDNNAVWYHVLAERYGSLGKLTVRAAESPAGRSEVSGTSPLTHTLFDMEPNPPIFVGGAPPDFEMPRVVRSRTFSGCIGGVTVDGQDIGLYDFRQLEGGQCDGCHAPPVSTDSGSALTYQFDGTGYATRSDYQTDSREFILTLSFKSFWKDALLFFTHNPENGDFISVELVEGFLVFRYGSESVMQTSFKYNNNQWVKVSLQASRQLRKAALIVNNQDEVIETALQRPLVIGRQVMYFAGAPVTVDVRRYGLTSLSFLGCMRDMQLGTKILNLLDGAGVVVGMKAGCQPQDFKTVGFEGSGHIELPSSDLDRDGGLSFTFKTYSKDGLLILAKGLNPRSFYSVSLLDGYLHAWFNGGVYPVTITSPRTYNDGKQHGVAIVKSNRRLDVYVDDERVGTGQLPQGASRITGMRGELGGLYVGGLPEGAEAEGRAASLEPFKGCIRDLAVNNQPLIFGTPLDYHKADIGRCDMPRIFPNIMAPSLGRSTTPHSFTITITLPTTPSTTTQQVITTTPAPVRLPTQCADPGIFTTVGGAIAFGDLVNSYAEILVRSRDIRKDFSMAVEIRSFYKRGVVFFITNELQDDYVAVQMKEGRIVVAYNDRKNDQKEITTNILVNDGFWHQVRLEKDYKSITVMVDDHAPISNSITRKIDVIEPIYVGGFDPRFTAAPGMITESFKGCMQNFNLNGNPTDLANSKRVMGVRPCFNKVERGVHFDGYSYATYAEFYRIESYLRIEFDFKTTKQDGVLISISNYRDNPALALELHNGYLKITAVNSGGLFLAVAGDCDHCLCDNKWHHVVAEYINNAVTLTVDNSSPKVGMGGNDLTLDLNNELYIGGIPSFGFQGVAQRREFFHGCIRNMLLNGTEVEWHKTFELENVHVAACPVAEDWDYL